MPTAMKHTTGTFCWPELATTDAKAAKAFYTTLLGWTTNESPMGPDSIYYMFNLGDRGVAAMHQPSREMFAAGMPAAWASYVLVENADATAAKAVSLGGTVVKEPFDVMDHGRMAVIVDPTGATFCVWQAKNHAGVGALGEPGSLGWTQLNCKQPEKAKPFYTGLFGWTYRDDPMPPNGAYTTWMKSDGMAGGMMPMPAEAPAPSHWLVYFAVANVDDSNTRALSLGAKSYVVPTDIPGTGRFAVLADPQGVTFALVTFGG